MEENRWQHCAFSQRMEIADKQHTSSKTDQNNARISCKFYLTSKQSEHVFHYLTRLITGQTLENNSSSSNSHAKFSQKVKQEPK